MCVRESESCFSGPRNASPQEITPSNYRVGERQLFVLPFITLIDKTELGWSLLMGGEEEQTGLG